MSAPVVEDVGTDRGYVVRVAYDGTVWASTVVVVPDGAPEVYIGRRVERAEVDALIERHCGAVSWTQPGLPW